MSVIKAANSIDPDAVKAQWEKMDTIEVFMAKQSTAETKATG